MPVAPALNIDFALLPPYTPVPALNIDFQLNAPYTQVPALNIDFQLMVPGRADPPSLNIDFALLPPVIIPALNIDFQLNAPVSPVPALNIDFKINPVYAFVRPENAATLPRVMRCYLVADGYDDLELAISSMSSRMSYGRQSFITVVAPDVIELVDAVTERSEGDIVIKYGYLLNDGTEALNELGRVGLQDIRTDQGANNFSITLSGYRHETNPTPKEVTLTGIEYIGTVNSLRRVRTQVNVDLRPGDLVHIDGEADLVCGSLTYTINTTSARMEISELDDFRLLDDPNDPDQADTVTDANGNETPILPWFGTGQYATESPN